MKLTETQSFKEIEDTYKDLVQESGVEWHEFYFWFSMPNNTFYQSALSFRKNNIICSLNSDDEDILSAITYMEDLIFSWLSNLANDATQIPKATVLVMNPDFSVRIVTDYENFENLNVDATRVGLNYSFFNQENLLPHSSLLKKFNENQLNDSFTKSGSTIDIIVPESELVEPGPCDLNIIKSEIKSLLANSKNGFVAIGYSNVLRNNYCEIIRIVTKNVDNFLKDLKVVLINNKLSNNIVVEEVNPRTFEHKLDLDTREEIVRREIVKLQNDLLTEAVNCSHKLWSEGVLEIEGSGIAWINYSLKSNSRKKGKISPKLQQLCEDYYVLMFKNNLRWNKCVLKYSKIDGNWQYEIQHTIEENTESKTNSSENTIIIDCDTDEVSINIKNT